MSTKRPKKTLLVSASLYLAVLTLIFAYAVLESGGILTLEWDRCMVGLGLLILIYFSLTNKGDLAPSLEWWFAGPLVLLLAFIGLQLVPLPAWLLRTISPTRAALLAASEHVSPGIISAPISVFPSGTVAHLLRVASYVVVFIMVRELAWRTLNRRWLVIAPIIVIAGAEAALGLFQFDWLMPESAAQGTSLSRNHFAGLLELSLPFAVVYPIATMTTPRQPFSKALLAAGSIALAALILLGILFSLSRMGFLASVSSLFVVACLTVWRRVSGRKRFAAAVLVGSAVVASSLYIVPDPLIRRFDKVATTSDLIPDPRFQVWADAWALARDYPLVGCGLGTYEQAFQKYKTFGPGVAVDSARNDYLQLLVELGGVGFAVAALAMLVVLLSAARAVVANVHSSTRYLGIACIAALVAILAHSFTDYNFYIPANAMLVAWIAGVVASLKFDSQARFTS